MSQMLTKEGTVSQKPSFKYTKSEKQTLENALKFDSLNNVLFPDTAKKFDASETVFLREQLTEMLKPIIEMWIPDYTARTVFPVRSMGAYGLDTVKYAEETWTGRALQAGKKQSGMPMVGESVNPTYVPVKHFELGADFSIYELRNAIYANYPLQAKKLEHAKTGQELALNDCVWGISPNSEDSVIPGLANQTSKLILSGDNSALANFNILDNAKTGTEIYDFIMAVISAPFAYTKKIMSQPDTLCLAPDQYNKVTSKRIGLTLGDTVAHQLKELFHVLN
jgi:hypothetical protein